jgi:hypothetical protein
MKYMLEELEGGGGFRATIESEDGHGTQVFEGATEKEVIDKLLVAQANATQKINEQNRALRKTVTPDPAQPETVVQRRPLTADEQFQVTEDLRDPTKAPAAVRKVVEAELGAPLETVRKRINEGDQDTAVRQGQQVAAEWMADHPDHFPSPHNSRVIINYLRNNNWAVTKKNLDLAFTDLTEAGLIQELAPAPGEEEGREEQPAVQPGADSRGTVTRPRAASTGLRNRNTNGAPGPAPTTQLKLTVAEIERMSEAEYREKYKDPKFRDAVDRAYAESAQRARNSQRQ